MNRAKIVTAAVGVLSAAATYGITIQGGGGSAASLNCPGGMTRLGHEFNVDIPVFPGDPAIATSNEYTVAEHGFLVEDIDTEAHAGTHLDAPGHFIDGGRTITSSTPVSSCGRRTRSTSAV